MKLTNKILAVIISGAILMALIIGVSFYIGTAALLQNTVTVRNVETAKETMNKVDRYLYERYNAIRAAATDPDFERIMAKGNKATATDIVTVNKKLGVLAQYTGPWDKVALIGTDGVTKYTLIASEVGENVIGTHIPQADFDRILKGETYYSDMIVDNHTSQPTMIFASPVYDESTSSRPVVGIVMGHLTWATVGTIVRSNDTSYVVELFNRQGVELSSDTADVNQRAELNTNNTAFFNNPAVKAALAGQSGSGIFPSPDNSLKREILAYTPETGYGEYHGNGWILMVQSPVKGTLSSTADNALLNALLGGVLILIISFLTYWIIRQVIMKPLVSLAAIATQFGNNDFSKRFLVTSDDEIAKLGGAFNDMANNIQASQARLEARVLDRTHELDETNKLMKSTLERVSQLKKFSDDQSALYQLMLESIGDAVVVLDEHKIITLVNSAGEHLLGGTQAQLIGKKVDDIVKFTFQDESEHFEKTEWSKALGTSNLTRLNIGMNLVGRSGKPIPVSATIAPIVSNDKNVGTIITIRDVREERELDETRTSFVSVASHQLRTPLTSMRWFSEMLLEGDAGQLTEQQRHFVESIYESTDRMTSLVTLLLQIARVEGKRLRVDPKPTNLRFHTNDVVLALRPMLDAKGQTVEIYSEPEILPEIPIDQAIMWQVVQNLLTNANRYAPKDSVITVRIIQKNDIIEYSVSDKGIGIPDKEKGRIFEKFYRADNALHAVPEGSGLGLALVHSLVLGWGGTIWFESIEGQGTTFYFTIPLKGMEKKEGEVSINL